MTKEEILASTEPVLVDVYSDGCGPCRAMMPLINELEAEGYKVVKLNAYSDVDFCVEHQISAVPTFLVFKEGKVVAKLQGMQKKAELLKALSS